MAKVIFAKHTLSDCLDSTFTASAFSVLRFPLFFFLFFSRFSRRQISLFTHCSRTIHALFTGPTATLFRKKYIKNGSHGTIHAFKNYFAIVFSVFSFQQNKRYLNISCKRNEIKFIILPLILNIISIVIELHCSLNPSRDEYS